MTQVEKIIAEMIRQRGQKVWFYAPDFQKPDMPKDLWVGYEASARMSDAVKQFPQLFAIKRDGKYRYARFRFEDLTEIFDNAPEALRTFLDQTFCKYGITKTPGEKVDLFNQL